MPYCGAVRTDHWQTEYTVLRINHFCCWELRSNSKQTLVSVQSFQWSPTTWKARSGQSFPLCRLWWRTTSSWTRGLERGSLDQCAYHRHQQESQRADPWAHRDTGQSWPWLPVVLIFFLFLSGCSKANFNKNIHTQNSLEFKHWEISNSEQMDSEETQETPPSLFTLKQEAERPLLSQGCVNKTANRRPREKILELKIRRRAQYSTLRKRTGFENVYYRN